MQKKITETTAVYGLGNPSQAKLFSVASGTYLGRRVALIQTTSGEIKLAWSDAPAVGWSSLVTVASDTRDGNFDALMTAAGDIHLVYSEVTTSYLVTRKLTFADGAWTAGSKVTIYNGTKCYDPSVALEPGGKLWVSFSRFITPNRWIHAKASTDDGATWGSGAADAGDQISGSSMFAWSKMIIDANSVHVIYNNQDTALSIRSQLITGGGWSSQYNLATGSGFGLHFDAAVGADGRLGVSFSRDQLYYREYDGSSWGATVVLQTHPVYCPQLVFEGNVPVVVYLDTLGGNVAIAKYTDRRTGSFSSSMPLDNRSAPFDSVVLYDATAATYEDLTTEADNNTTADIYHSSSGCLIKDDGDILYLGMDARFRGARFWLSTVGAGGAIQASYWDGSNWQSFIPANGSSDLSGTTNDLLFWTDYASVPLDWQKQIINSQSRYWVKLEVTSDFSTGPVGSQFGAALETNRLILRR